MQSSILDSLAGGNQNKSNTQPSINTDQVRKKLSDLTICDKQLKDRIEKLESGQENLLTAVRKAAKPAPNPTQSPHSAPLQTGSD